MEGMMTESQILSFNNTHKSLHFKHQNMSDAEFLP